MKKTIAITSDLHVRGQFEKHVQYTKAHLGVSDLNKIITYIAGDMTPAYDGEWKDDPGYAAKKRIRKELAGQMSPEEVEAIARQAQEDVWETNTKEMILYGLRSQEMSQELVDIINDSTLIRNARSRWRNHIRKILGNSTKIISDVQKKAMEIAGVNKPTIEDLMTHNNGICIYNDVSEEGYGEALIITIPYTEDNEKQEMYVKQVRQMGHWNGIKDVFIVYHENRFPELVGLPHNPVVMTCLHEMVDNIKSLYPHNTVYEVAGHTHSIPEGDFRIETPDKTLFIPVGPDIETMTARTLVIKPGEGIKEVRYDLTK